MDLELKILKEKVVEDEKKSGIGSLFDDEKSSFQHISLLKSKYQKMRRDFDMKIDELNKIKLNVVGEQFVLDAQVHVMLNQNKKIEEVGKEYDRDYKKRNFELEKNLKDISKLRFDFENELKTMEHDLTRESDENYSSQVTVQKENAFKDVADKRFRQEIGLDEELMRLKDDEINRIKEEREQVKLKERSNEELQKLKAEAKTLLEKIDEGLVKHELLQISVAELEISTANLNDKKEELNEDKKKGDLKNEELIKDLKAKEEINEKKL